MLTREQALELLKKKIRNPNLIKHSLAVEAVMRALARRFRESEEKWGLAGLVHDIDYEETKNNPKAHSKIGAEYLESLGVEKEICKAVLAHNEIHKIEPKSLMAKALFCVDPLTGLIVASCLVLPSKKLIDLKVQNVLNRFSEKAFARGVSREIIKKSKDYLGLELKEFIEIALGAMQEISEKLGL